MNKGIIAVFGGSFNPPANSHFLLAKQVIEEIKEIEKIVFVPVSTKYSKPELLDDKHRVNMLRIICQRNTKFEVSDIELKSDKQPYTIETLDEMQKQNKNKDIYFIIGTDNLKELYRWHKPDELLKKYKMLALKRDEDRIEDIISNCALLSKYESSIIELKNISKINLSSTMIREKIKNGESIKDLVPNEVREYIEKKQLYTK